MGRKSAYTPPNNGIHGPADHPTQNKTVPGNVTLGNDSAFPHYGPTGAGGAGTGPESQPAATAGDSVANAAGKVPVKKGRKPGARFTSLAALRDYSKTLAAGT